MADIYIKLDQLSEVKGELDAIITEFEGAVSQSEALEAAIGTPYGDGRLRDQARDFEERWDRKRNDLKDGLVGLRDHMQGVIDGINEADAEMAIALTPEA